MLSAPLHLHLFCVLLLFFSCFCMHHFVCASEYVYADYWSWHISIFQYIHLFVHINSLWSGFLMFAQLCQFFLSFLIFDSSVPLCLICIYNHIAVCLHLRFVLLLPLFDKTFSFLRGTKEKQREHNIWMDIFAGCWLFVCVQAITSQWCFYSFVGFTVYIVFVYAICYLLSLLPRLLLMMMMIVSFWNVNCPQWKRSGVASEHALSFNNLLEHPFVLSKFQLLLLCDVVIILKTNEVLYTLYFAIHFYFFLYLLCFFFFASWTIRLALCTSW